MKSPYISYTVQDGQNIYDVAVQFYGSVEEVIRILEDNPSIDVNMDITGLPIIINTTATVTDAYTQRIIRDSQQSVATGSDDYISPWLTSEGEYWAVSSSYYFQL